MGYSNTLVTVVNEYFSITTGLEIIEIIWVINITYPVYR